MVRRSTVDRSPQPDLYSADYDPGAGSQQAGTGKRPRSGPGWRGAGGRWLVWTFRIVVWAVLLIIGYRGVMAIVLNETPPSHTPPAPAASTPGFPVQEASAYALQFGQVYLNASPGAASQRESELAPFLPPGAADPQLGWNGGGSLTLQSEQVAGVRVEDAQHAVITLLARVNGNMMELGVPVYAASGGLGISGEPAWLAAPKSVAQPAPPSVNSDPAAESELMRQLPAFFHGLRERGSVDAWQIPRTRHFGDRSGRLRDVRFCHQHHGTGRRHRPSHCCHRRLGSPWGRSKGNAGGKHDGSPRDDLCADHCEAAWYLVCPEHCPIHPGRGAAVTSRRVDCSATLLSRNPLNPGVGRCRSIR